MQMPKFKTVKQLEGSKVCVGCVSAMAVGRGLRYVQNRMTLNRGGYYKWFDMIKFLADHSISLLSLTPEGGNWFDPKQELTLKVSWKRPAILTVPSEVFNGKHVVFWDGKYVRDPSPLKPMTSKLQDYNVLEVDFLTYY